MKDGQDTQVAPQATDDVELWGRLVCKDAEGAITRKSLLRLVSCEPLSTQKPLTWGGVFPSQVIAVALYEALEPFAEHGRDLLLAQCHIGLVPMTKCGRCTKVLAARRALADYKEVI